VIVSRNKARELGLNQGGCDYLQGAGEVKAALPAAR